MRDEGYPKGVGDVSGLTMPVKDVEGVDCHGVLNLRGDVVEEVLLTRNPLTLGLAKLSKSADQRCLPIKHVAGLPSKYCLRQ